MFSWTVVPPFETDNHVEAAVRQATSECSRGAEPITARLRGLRPVFNREAAASERSAGDEDGEGLRRDTATRGRRTNGSRVLLGTLLLGPPLPSKPEAVTNKATSHSAWIYPVRNLIFRSAYDAKATSIGECRPSRHARWSNVR